MTQSVLYDVEDGVAILSVNNPPVNALGAAVRAGLADGLEHALADTSVKAIVIRGQGRTFPAGADISEFCQPPADPCLPELCNRFEASEKPVVAALHGTALGGGFELALAAHYRVANRGARFGLPEVTLGILPGAGGTQRTPRLVGADFALDLMLSGKPMPVTAPEASAFFDEIIEGDLREGAKRFALDLVASNAGVRPTQNESSGFQDAVAYQRAIASRRDGVARNPELAPREILRCVEAAELLPFEQGLAFERAAFEQCVESDQSAALRHVFFAERRAAKFDGIDTGQAHDVRAVGIVGGGERGCGLAVQCLGAGLDVVLVELDSSTLEDAVSRIEQQLALAEHDGRMSSGARQNQIDRLSGATDLVDLADVDLVIEAVPDDLASKLTVFSQLDGLVKEDAILVTTSANPDLERIADEVGDPVKVVGLHFYSSVRHAKLVEVIIGTRTSNAVVATVLTLAKRIHKIPVRAGLSDGFIAQCLMAAYRFAADSMLLKGATPLIVDEAMTNYGMAFGPYEQLDQEGLQRSSIRRQRLVDTGASVGHARPISDVLFQAGRSGRKMGLGFYHYIASTEKGENDPEVIAMIRGARILKGIQARRVRADEIQRRCLAAMVNEGARLLREGIAVRPSDIDMVMIHGCCFPRWRGGPMMAADLKGLLNIQGDLKDYAQENADFWAPEPVFQQLIKNGDGFSDLNTENP